MNERSSSEYGRRSSAADGSPSKRPCFIGIAGGSCSGKTTLAHHVAQRLAERGAALISIDSYYRGLTSAASAAIERYNFDDPAALDCDLLIRHLADLAAGRSVDRPVYDFRTHMRTDRTERIDPVSFVIVEGLFPLYWEKVRDLMDTKVFIEVSHEVCLARRLQRDTVERARPREEVIRRYNEMARPMYEKYVLPSRHYADVIVDGEPPVEESVAMVLGDVRRKAT